MSANGSVSLSRWLMAALFSVCMTLAGTVGYLVSVRFAAAESATSALTIRVEILEGDNVRLNVPLDTARIERLVKQEIWRQTHDSQKEAP